MEKTLIKLLLGLLIVFAMAGCKLGLRERGIGVEFGAKLEDRKVWLGIGITKSPELAERETLDADWEIVEEAARDNFPTIEK